MNEPSCGDQENEAKYGNGSAEVRIQSGERTSRSRVTSALLLTVYLAVLGRLLSVRPLWLDEIIQLIGTRTLGFHELMKYIAHDPGQAPLAYLLQSAILHRFGYSLFAARVLSLGASGAACAAMAQVGRKGSDTALEVPPRQP